MQRSGSPMRAPSAQRTPATFRLEGDVWTIAFGEELCRLRDSAGLRYLAALLGRPGLKVLAADLVVLAGRANEDVCLPTKSAPAPVSPMPSVQPCGTWLRITPP